MAAPLVECVPNFSEGQNRETLDALRAAITSVLGVRLLDVQADGSHNRSVFTLVAPPDAAAEAAFRSMRVATERIDLTKHTGQHPRMGATDVVPFVPVRDMTMDECVALARRLAERAATELAIPIYLYARAATRPERERLPDIRKGEFEGLRDRIGTDPAADPDLCRSGRANPRTHPCGCRVAAPVRGASRLGHRDRSESRARSPPARRAGERAPRTRPSSCRGPARTGRHPSPPCADAGPCASSNRCARSQPACCGRPLPRRRRGARRA